MYQDRTLSPGCWVQSGCLEKKLTQRRHYYSVKEEMAKYHQPYLDKECRRRCGLSKQLIEKEWRWHTSANTQTPVLNHKSNKDFHLSPKVK